MLAVQYLEPGAHIAEISPAAAAAHLREACERIAIDCVIVGWELPQELVEACAREAQRAGARLYLWHPLLTGSAAVAPRPEWLTVGPGGERVPGFMGLAEFTFLCPNQAAVQEAVLNRLERSLQDGLYQGVFLDRIRWPSPSADPLRYLACFCPDCRRAAAKDGLDLERVRRSIGNLAPDQLADFTRQLLDPWASFSLPGSHSVVNFLDWRTQTITRSVQAAAEIIRQHGLEVGLDCFSPLLTRMVGQNLTELDRCCDWIKIMTYGHTLAPAGLPFELSNLLDWLAKQGAIPQGSLPEWFASAAKLPLEGATLTGTGLSPAALQAEVARGRMSGVRQLLAGIELVDLPGITQLSPAQIAADLQAMYQIPPDGLVLSWDLWRIALERLEGLSQTIVTHG